MNTLYSCCHTASWAVCTRKAYT